MKLKKWLLFGLTLTLAGTVFAGGGAADDIAGAADSLKGNLDSVANLIISVAYIAGLGFAVGAVLKFKQHKDNPTQIPVGTPIAMLFVAVALLFLPSVLKITGKSIFGADGSSLGASTDKGGDFLGGSN